MLTSKKKFLLWTVLVVLLLPALTVIGIGTYNRIRSSGRIQDGLIHPTPDNIPEIADSRFIVRHKPRNAEGASAFIDTLRYEELAIGVYDGSPSEMFGSIDDVEIDYRDYAFVVDSPSKEIGVFDYDGAHVSTIGGPGEGPGEFPSPLQNVLITSRATVVAVLSGQKAHVFDRTSDTSFAFRSSFIRDGFVGFGGCTMNDHLYLLAVIPERDGMIHKHTTDGAIVSTIGALYKSDNMQIVRHLSTKARLACSAKYNVIAYLMNYSPVLTGYHETGQLAWRVSFADFAPMKVTERRTPDGRNRISFSNTEVGEGFYTNIFAHGDYFYVSYRLRGEDSGQLFRVHAQTGQPTYLGTIDTIVYGIDRGYIITGSNFPFPHVKIHAKK